MKHTGFKQNLRQGKRAQSSLDLRASTWDALGVGTTSCKRHPLDTTSSSHSPLSPYSNKRNLQLPSAKEQSWQFSKQSPCYLPPLPPFLEAITVHQKERTTDILLGPRFLQQLFGLSGQNIHLLHPVCYSCCKFKLSSVYITWSFL